MRIPNRCSDIYKKIYDLSKNCGVKLRSKSESKTIIEERILQLMQEGKENTQEYVCLTLMLERC